MSADPECLFCKIIAGEIGSDVVYSTDRVMAFRDIDPKAPLHVLIAPRDHAPDLATTAAVDPAVVADLVGAAAAIAEAEGYADYNLVANTGRNAGQTVFHTHLHLMAGARMTSLPA